MNTRRRSLNTSVGDVVNYLDSSTKMKTLSKINQSVIDGDESCLNYDKDSDNKSHIGDRKRRSLRQKTVFNVTRDSPHMLNTENLNVDSVSTLLKVKFSQNKKLRRPTKIIPICGLCLGTSELNNKTEKAESLIACWECGQSGHPSCLQMPPDLVSRIRLLRWCCVDCKRCCLCQSNSRVPRLMNDVHSDLLLCDYCDRGFHLNCVDPNITEPPEGSWSCSICSQSSTTGTLDPKLRAIELCDQLTQHEIDWMTEAVNQPGVNLSSPNRDQPIASMSDSSPIYRKSSKSPSSVKSSSKRNWSKMKNDQLDSNSSNDELDVAYARGRGRGRKRMGQSCYRKSTKWNSYYNHPKSKSLLTSPKSSLSLMHRSKSRSTYSRKLNFLKKRSHLSGVRRGRLCRSRCLRDSGGGRVLLNSRPKRGCRSVNSSRVGVDSSDDSDLFLSTDDDSDDDDTSSGTLAAAQFEYTVRQPASSGRGRPKKKTVVAVAKNLGTGANTSGPKERLSTSYLDSENDEMLEMATISDEHRNLFEQIQKDVQSCLPQAMESSLSLPPANNPRLLLSDLTNNGDSAVIKTPSNKSAATEKSEEVRYPPKIQFGRYIITTWYSAPYPSEYARLNLLYICEFCLKYNKTRKVYLRHIEKCSFRFPPGNEIYRSGNISVFEVDGYTSRLYCQQLCLLAKLFLDHKTLYYDVEPFLFYVVTVQTDDHCLHVVGYFSKEKRSVQKYNLSCIMVLPPYQKQAYGRFLIDFSFLLSRIEGQPGSPEKPLSELGNLSYQSYWRSKILPFLTASLRSSDSDDDHRSDLVQPTDVVVTIYQISTCTGIDPHDVASTMQQLAAKIELNGDGKLVLNFDLEKLLQLKEKYDKRSTNWIPIDEECLRWSPLIHPHELDHSCDSNAGLDGSDIPSTDCPTPTPTSTIVVTSPSLKKRLSIAKPIVTNDEPSENRRYLRSSHVGTQNGLVMPLNGCEDNKALVGRRRILSDQKSPKSPSTIDEGSIGQGLRKKAESKGRDNGNLSPCKRSFFLDGPRPPDPPSPHDDRFSSSRTVTNVGGRVSSNTTSNKYSNGNHNRANTNQVQSSNRRFSRRSRPTKLPVDDSNHKQVTLCFDRRNCQLGLDYLVGRRVNDESATFGQLRVGSLMDDELVSSPLRPNFASSPRIGLSFGDDSSVAVNQCSRLTVTGVRQDDLSTLECKIEPDTGRSIIESHYSVNSPSPPMLSLADGLSVQDESNSISCLPPPAPPAPPPPPHHHHQPNLLSTVTVQPQQPPCLSVYDTDLEYNTAKNCRRLKQTPLSLFFQTNSHLKTPLYVETSLTNPFASDRLSESNPTQRKAKKRLRVRSTSNDDFVQSKRHLSSSTRLRSRSVTRLPEDVHSPSPPLLKCAVPVASEVTMLSEMVSQNVAEGQSHSDQLSPLPPTLVKDAIKGRRFVHLSILNDDDDDDDDVEKADFSDSLVCCPDPPILLPAKLTSDLEDTLMSLDVKSTFGNTLGYASLNPLPLSASLSLVGKDDDPLGDDGDSCNSDHSTLQTIPMCDATVVAFRDEDTTTTTTTTTSVHCYDHDDRQPFDDSSPVGSDTILFCHGSSPSLVSSQETVAMRMPSSVDHRTRAAVSALFAFSTKLDRCKSLSDLTSVEVVDYDHIASGCVSLPNIYLNETKIDYACYRTTSPNFGDCADEDGMSVGHPTRADDDVNCDNRNESNLPPSAALDDIGVGTTTVDFPLLMTPLTNDVKSKGCQSNELIHSEGPLSMLSSSSSCATLPIGNQDYDSDVIGASVNNTISSTLSSTPLPTHVHSCVTSNQTDDQALSEQVLEHKNPEFPPPLDSSVLSTNSELTGDTCPVPNEQVPTLTNRTSPITTQPFVCQEHMPTISLDGQSACAHSTSVKPSTKKSTSRKRRIKTCSKSLAVKTSCSQPVFVSSHHSTFWSEVYPPLIAYDDCPPSDMPLRPNSLMSPTVFVQSTPIVSCSPNYVPSNFPIHSTADLINYMPSHPPTTTAATSTFVRLESASLFDTNYSSYSMINHRHYPSSTQAVVMGGCKTPMQVSLSSLVHGSAVNYFVSSSPVVNPVYYPPVTGAIPFNPVVSSQGQTSLDDAKLAFVEPRLQTVLDQHHHPHNNAFDPMGHNCCEPMSYPTILINHNSTIVTNSLLAATPYSIATNVYQKDGMASSPVSSACAVNMAHTSFAIDSPTSLLSIGGGNGSWIPTDFMSSASNQSHPYPSQQQQQQQHYYYYQHHHHHQDSVQNQQFLPINQPYPYPYSVEDHSTYNYHHHHQSHHHEQAKAYQANYFPPNYPLPT